MNSKILNILLIAIFSISLANTANAGLIVGNLYADENGIQWEYVGNYDLAHGRPLNSDPLAVNGIEAAIINFGALSATQTYALSSNLIADYSNINDYIVNYLAWYDIYDGGPLGRGISELSESLVANQFGGPYYDTAGDMSAFVLDRAFVGDNINHVFKSVNVPEPSSLAIFSLALISLSMRRSKS